MEILKQIKIGSSAFFDTQEGFSSKDTDWVCLVDSHVGFGKSVRVMLGNDDVIMYHRDTKKEDFMNDVLQGDNPIKVGKFLVPEFIEYFGVTIEDLKTMKDVVEQLDDKHCYEKIIYDSYINQGNFELKEDILNKAYKEYLRYRK